MVKNKDFKVKTAEFKALLMKTEEMNTIDLSENLTSNKEHEQILNSAVNIYGRLPLRPDHLYVKTLSEEDINEDGAVLRKHELICEYGNELCSFPFRLLTPTESAPARTVVYMSSGEDERGQLFPYNEILDMGISVFEFSTEEVVSLSDGIRRRVPNTLLGKRRGPTSAGKLAIYAYLASRILDYALTLSEADGGIAVVGRGILAEAALISCAYDQRFTGAALLDFGSDTEGVDLFCMGYHHNTYSEERLLNLVPLFENQRLCICGTGSVGALTIQKALGASNSVSAFTRCDSVSIIESLNFIYAKDKALSKA